MVHSYQGAIGISGHLSMQKLQANCLTPILYIYLMRVLHRFQCSGEAVCHGKNLGMID